MDYMTNLNEILTMVGVSVHELEPEIVPSGDSLRDLVKTNEQHSKKLSRKVLKKKAEDAESIGSQSSSDFESDIDFKAPSSYQGSAISISGSQSGLSVNDDVKSEENFQKQEEFSIMLKATNATDVGSAEEKQLPDSDVTHYNENMTTESPKYNESTTTESPKYNESTTTASPKCKENTTTESPKYKENTSLEKIDSPSSQKSKEVNSASMSDVDVTLLEKKLLQESATTELWNVE